MTERFECPPEHRHGETSTCYCGHKCRCDACVTRNTEYRYWYRRRNIAGRTPPNAPISDSELMDLVGDRLASYKRPSRVVFVPEIPRLPSGKVLRRVLKERLWTSV